MIRLALVDCDVRLARDYAQAAERLRNITLSAMAHEDESVRSQIAETISTATRGLSLEQLLDASPTEFDAVLIHGRTGRRAEAARRAAAAGKHVLVASPLGLSPAEADQVIDACRSAAVRLMVAELARFRPSRVVVKQALDSGKLGAVALLRQHAWEPAGGVEEVTDILPLDGPGRGEIWTHVVSALDQAVWMFGSSPVEIFTQGRTRTHRRSRHKAAGKEKLVERIEQLDEEVPRLGLRTEDASSSVEPEYLQIQLRFSAGGMALLSVATSLPAGDGYDSLSIIGATGAAYADDQYQTQLLYRGANPLALKTGEGVVAMTALLREFVSAITQGRDPAVTGVDGKVALQLVNAVYESWRNGQPVAFQGACDVPVG